MSREKIVSIVLYILMGVSAILVVLFYAGGVVPGTEGTNLEEPKITETILIWSYGLAIAAAFFSLIFPVINMILNPKNAKKTLISLGIAAVFIIIAYLLASDSVMRIPGYTGTDNVPSTLKLVGTGLIFTYILVGIAIVSILYSEVAKYFK